MTYKSFWKSKTFWFNVLAAAVMVASALGFEEFQPNTEFLAVVAAIVNVVLRLISSRPVTMDMRKVGTRAV